MGVAFGLFIPNSEFEQVRSEVIGSYGNQQHLDLTVTTSTGESIPNVAIGIRGNSASIDTDILEIEVLGCPYPQYSHFFPEHMEEYDTKLSEPMHHRLVVAKRIATVGMIAIFSASIVFHILVITGVIPYTIVWGGRVTNQSEMYVFESISLVLNVLFLCVVLAKGGILRTRVSEKVLDNVLRGMGVVFFLNTIGNVMSTNTFEQWVFTPITFLLSLFALILTFKEQEKPKGTTL